jgi:hypothetical protein
VSSGEDPKICRLVCRSCKVEIVANNETLTIVHAIPECEWFAALCKRQGESGVIDEAGGEVK